MQKRYFSYIIFSSVALLLVGVFYGCVKNPLNQNPTGQYTTSNYWQTQNDVITGISGIYNVLYVEDWIGHDLYVYDDQSDDISVDGDHPDFKVIESLNADATQQLVYLTWPFAYEQIARANNALIYIPKVSVMDDSIRNRSMGEAYFLRAYAYYILSNIYGDVPVIKEDNVLAGNYNVPKSVVDSIRAFVESDFLKAADLLPETYGEADKGRVSKGAAWGMLCKLYMTEDRLDDAITYGSKVVNDPNYALASDYRMNFTSGQQEDNTELLFAVWNGNGELNLPNSLLSTYFSPRAWQGWGFHLPTQNFADGFEADDTIRKRATLISIGDSVPYQTNMATVSAFDAQSPSFTGMAGASTGRLLPSMTNTGYFVHKYTAYLANGDGGIDNNLKQPLLRSADVYLLVAEAKIRKSGAGAGDAEINAVRRRAGIQPLAAADIPQLIHERRVELGGENIRWQDLLRWDKDKLINLDTIVGKPKTASPLPPYNGATVVPARTFTRPKNYYIPIPQEIIDESKGVITQNPNY
ncbi:MAG: RagB/SusD family nutrient uptake outer membrane protein [Chitinophagaceae bacterium]|jgi:hypothetical protein|nr:RagB/SusD family nutrient uptake outer membrane protein [Chitinophagaceae bacterium]